MSFNSPFTGNVIVPTDVSYRSITLSANVVLEWPINGNATPNYAARIMDVTATAGSLVMRMPPANQASVGQDALIRNVGATSFTVADYDGNVIAVVTAGVARYIYITTNPDEAGTWGIIAFGAGSSAADAASLVGYGLTVIGSTLNAAHPVQSLSALYTTVAADRAKTFVWFGGATTLTLTSAATLGNNWFILLRNDGTGTLTVSPSGGQLINSASLLTMQPTESAIICCSGTAFFTIGIGKSTDFNFSQNTKAVTSGSYTLSASEASNPIQKFTGVLSGNVTVVLPQTIAVYYISNQTDGTASNYTITFETGVVGGTTVSVPASQQVILVCDSTNLYNASTISNVYAGAAVFTADITVHGATVGRGGSSVSTNTAVGYIALATNTSGSGNSAFGFGALFNNAGGGKNTGSGFNAGGQNTSGQENVFVGYDAGSNVTTGSNNTIIGSETSASAASGTSQVVVGQGLTGKGNSTAYIGGSAGAYNEKNVTTWEITSDERIKKNIVDNNVGLDVIDKIQVRNFEYRAPKEIVDLPGHAAVYKPGVQLGAIAQELRLVLPDSVYENSTGVLSINTDALIWHLINSVKELSARVRQLEGRQ
jgi:hypothetical protein